MPTNINKYKILDTILQLSKYTSIIKSPVMVRVGTEAPPDSKDSKSPAKRTKTKRTKPKIMIDNNDTSKRRHQMGASIQRN